MNLESLDETETAPGAVPLTQMRAGERGRLHATRLVLNDREMLHALGLAERSPFRVCKAGDPWILQVRSTRIGMSFEVAHRILVIPDGSEP